MTTAAWWSPQRHADRRPLLLARGRIRDALRGWFLARHFTEVETAALTVSPGNETHLHAFTTELRDPAGGRSARHLRTSPEFACKKLLAAGEQRIFEFARVWRNRERGALHHPEFTMLEWYRAAEGYETLMDDCAAVLGEAAQAASATQLLYRDKKADPFAAPERITVAEAFQRHAGIDLFATMRDGVGNRDRLASAAASVGVESSSNDTWEDVFSRILVARVEPNLGVGAPTILYDYPAPLAALARRKASDPRVAERFELYACGVELANGFGELTDAAEQRRRFEADMAEKQRRYGERYPIDEDFLAALGAMPAASGIALGFDRLVMLATGAPKVDDVMWTPVADV